VTGTHGEPIASREYKDYVCVAAKPAAAVDISYYYVPEPLILPGDEPELPENRVDACAYVYYALSMYYMSENRFNEARAWELRYRSIVDNISQLSATTEEITASSEEATAISERNLQDAESTKEYLDEVISSAKRFDKYLESVQ
jgi:hypothetical protein